MEHNHKAETKKTHTLIISDLHLGTPVSRADKALKLLQSYSFRKLILLGDVFESLNFKKLDKDCWELLNYIGKITKDRKVRWVLGNHDAGLHNVFDSLMGARIYETYTWQYKHEKYLATHGHQFDRFLVNNAVLSHMATVMYDFIQRMDSDEKKFSHWLKRKSKGWLRLSDKVARSAIRYGKKHEANYVFCGHTHKAMKKHSHDIKYFNSGCWTDDPCTYITIDEDNIKIHEY
ncbi:MAG: UDP-2,3-diacylglucosamine diphosphatase [Candidatus Moranbacteria bacterium CG10_big_fil_rev_8_21_14_0_10_35_21]|nr:MAG: UDP-2,3-diacylglucosamine diphosphatase [Candidatus Moranbacteria bacterium CG10_big_fil_rev_8_21_14_0_10_35_21]PJA88610.1 MAG: UDP-2,3-diacylglucosamine diphosphatase [Candidatus Moranbacteria bacterium CG_4_9_14_3_um_filter_36_9]